MRTIKIWLSTALESMGTNTTGLDWEKLYPFGIDSNTNKPLPAPQRALIRISWRAIYKNLTAVSRDNEFFRPEKVITEIARNFMSRILAYQEERCLHNWKLLHSPSTNKLPQKLKITVSPIGDLNLDDGSISIRTELRQVLVDQGVWTAHPHGISRTDIKKRKRDQHTAFGPRKK